MADSSKYGTVTVENDSLDNPLNGTDEPVFILRASDETANAMLGYYGKMNPDLEMAIAEHVPLHLEHGKMSIES